MYATVKALLFIQASRDLRLDIEDTVWGCSNFEYAYDSKNYFISELAEISTYHNKMISHKIELPR